MLRKKRKKNEIRPVEIEVNYLNLVPGSVRITQGNTIVLASASVNDSVPSFLQGSGQGWITAQYAMLPKSTPERVSRERKYISGRTYEIQRLIGRALRQAFHLDKFGERTVLLDCDVIQADGGTRTASITAGFVSVYEVFRQMREMGDIGSIPLRNWIAAISCGILEDEIYLDLNYEEDAACDADFNIVMNREGEMVEIQGTGEKKLFGSEEVSEIMEVSRNGISELIEIQEQVLNS